MITKERIKKSVDDLPDDFSMEDLIEELILLDKIEQGRRDYVCGDVFTTDEVKEHFEKWEK
jgi:hypothetical protein